MLIAFIFVYCLARPSNAQPIPNATCPPGQSQCCVDPKEPIVCPTESPCYDPTSTICCNLHQPVCYSPTLCNMTTEFCALPCFGCENAGAPVCCPILEGHGAACKSRRDIACYDDRTAQCCTNSCNFYVQTCPSNMTCCVGNESGTCCPLDGVCCPEDGTDGGMWCCDAGQKCSTIYNQCINQQGETF